MKNFPLMRANRMQARVHRASNLSSHWQSHDQTEYREGKSIEEGKRNGEVEHVHCPAVAIKDRR